MGHFWNLLELNSGRKPSEFHSENNSSSYAAAMDTNEKIDECAMTWNERLKQARTAKGWSVPDLARSLFPDDHEQAVALRERIYKYEKAVKPVAQPRGSAMADLAKALDVTIEWLRDGQGSAVNDLQQIDTSVIASSGTAPVVSIPENAAKVNEPFPKNTVRKWIYELGRAAGGKEGKFILNGEQGDRVLCPPNLENSSAPYLVRVFGTSMEPRFRHNERLEIDPDEPYGKGDDIVVQLHTTDETVFECYVKTFVSMNSKELVLQQMNPPPGAEATIRFPRSRVHKIHKVVGMQMATRHQI